MARKTIATETSTTRFDVQGWIQQEETTHPGFAAAVEAELANLRLGERLRELRKTRAITQAQLAKRMGISQGAVAQLENAEPGRMEIRTLAKMVTALGYALKIDFEPEPVAVRVATRTISRRVASKKR